MPREKRILGFRNFWLCSNGRGTFIYIISVNKCAMWSPVNKFCFLVCLRKMSKEENIRGWQTEMLQLPLFQLKRISQLSLCNRHTCVYTHISTKQNKNSKLLPYVFFFSALYCYTFLLLVLLLKFSHFMVFSYMCKLHVNIVNVNIVKEQCMEHLLKCR